MHYLESVIDETLRIYPGASRIQRITDKDYEYNGMKIQKGTTIFASVVALHNDPGKIFKI